MGDYTGVRFTAKLNELGARVADRLDKDPWPSWSDIAADTPELEIPQWSKIGRRDFIPRGAVCYMPPEWGDNTRKVVDGVWDVVCSLKNYGDEIDVFLEEVLPQLITEPCTVEVLYERDRADRGGKGPHLVTVAPREETPCQTSASSGLPTSST